MVARLLALWLRGHRNRVLKAGYNEGLSATDDDGVVSLINSMTNPPTGRAVDFYNDIVAAIGAHYGVTLTTAWTFFPGSRTAFRVRAAKCSWATWLLFCSALCVSVGVVVQ
jgi:hypothetical protein